MNITYGIIRTFGVVVLLAVASVQCSKIHERMTDEEIANIFRTTRDKLPEYDVALVRHNRYKRSNQYLRMQFGAFGEQVDAYLNPSDGQLMGENTPVWLASSKPYGRIEYTKMREGIVGRVVSKFFTSSRDLSTVAVTQTKGENPSFNGIVRGMVIRSLPKSLQEEVRSGRNIEASNASRTMLDSDYHVIIKSSSVAEEEKIRRLEEQIREASGSGNRTDASRFKRSNQQVIYPSLLVETAYNVSKKTQNENDYYEDILYQLAYWNGVDLRFRQVNDPKIRLRIVGIIIGQDRAATPYLENYRFGDVIDMNQGFNKMKEYWYNMNEREDFRATAYDIVVTLTDAAMMYEQRYVRGISKFAYYCTPPHNRNFDAVAVARDNRGFDGILTTTHELGHIFGLNHDPTSLGECNTWNGFIMTIQREPTPKNLEWSPCSLRALSYFLRGQYIWCYDVPAGFHPPGYPVQRVLPGDVLGPDKQCQARGYASACAASPDMCTQMQCLNDKWQPGRVPEPRCENAGPAAEGTHCANDHKCVDGVCQCMTMDCNPTSSQRSRDYYFYG